MNGINLSPRDVDIINRFLGGQSRTQIAAAYCITTQAVISAMNKQAVRDVIVERLEKLSEKVLEFKLDAVDGAIDGLGRLREFVDPANPKAATKELIRLASNDLIKVAGLEPRKRLLVESNNLNGIDEDTRDWLTQILHEAGLSGVVDVDGNGTP